MSTRKFCDLCDGPAEGQLPTHEIEQDAIVRFVLKIDPRRIYHGGSDNGEPLDVCHTCLAKNLRALAENLEANR